MTSSTVSSHFWVTDFGATDHTVGMSNLFSSLSPVSYGQVKLGNGSFTNIAGKGTITVSSTLNLSSMLHVPHLSSNLLSVSALTKTLNCSVTFFLLTVSFKI